MKSLYHPNSVDARKNYILVTFEYLSKNLKNNLSINSILFQKNKERQNISKVAYG